jgi:hypothetical protein
MKKCRKCGIEKPLSDYYKHKQMGDGHLNICIDCTKQRIESMYKEKMKDPQFAEKEKERNRLKYHRLYNDGRHKPSYESKKKTMEKYKEKYPEKIKAQLLSSNIKAILKGNQLHHWSYNDEHFRDVIELTVEEHNLVHRKTIYDQERKMYRRSDNNELLDSREASLSYYSEILNRPF